MNDSILNRARDFVDAEWPHPQEAIDIVPELLTAYDELEEKYLELIYTPTGIAFDERHAHALNILENWIVTLENWSVKTGG